MNNLKLIEINKYQQCYEAVKQNLQRPSTLEIANHILNHQACHELQQKNNLFLLHLIKATVDMYVVDKYEVHRAYLLDNTELLAEDDERDNFFGKDLYSLNQYMELNVLNQYIELFFSKVDSEFDDDYETEANFRSLFIKFCGNELDRLSCMTKEIARIYMYKKFSDIAFGCEVFNTALLYQNYGMMLLHASLMQMNYENKNYFKQMASVNNALAAHARWKKPNMQRREKKKLYLDIFRKQGFTTYAAAAEYIKREVDTGEKPAYSTVLRWLSEADKGNMN